MTKPAVEKGIIPELYKANRKKKPPDEAMLNWIKQKPELQAAVSLTNIPQIRVEKEDNLILIFAMRCEEQFARELSDELLKIAETLKW